METELEPKSNQSGRESESKVTESRLKFPRIKPNSLSVPEISVPLLLPEFHLSVGRSTPNGRRFTLSIPGASYAESFSGWNGSSGPGRGMTGAV